MRRTQLYLDEKQRRLLEEHSLRSGKSIGHLVREAVDEVYGRRRPQEKPLSGKDPIWSFIGRGASKEGDLAARHDRYLYGKDDEDVR